RRRCGVLPTRSTPGTASAGSTGSIWVICSPRCSTCSAPTRGRAGERGMDTSMSDMSGASDYAAPLAPAADRRASTLARAWKVLEGVMDPELPQLSVVELGIIRSVDTPD